MSDPEEGCCVSFDLTCSKSGKVYFAECRSLDVTGQGDSIRLALQNLHEAMGIVLEHASDQELVRRAMGREIEDEIRRVKDD